MIKRINYENMYISQMCQVCHLAELMHRVEKNSRNMLRGIKYRQVDFEDEKQVQDVLHYYIGYTQVQSAILYTLYY